MPDGTKETTGFIIDVETGDNFDFQYNPSEFIDDKSTAWAAVKVPGMSHPRYQFVSGEARSISFKVHLFKGPVKKKVDWLRSLLYPEHAGTMLKHAPHKVLLVVGDLYPGVQCIVRQVKARYFGLFDRATLAPQRAEVDVVLEEYVETSVDYGQVR